MLTLIDNLLNRITMYRLVLYFLILIWLNALVVSFFGILPFTPLGLLFSSAVILIICYVVNELFAWAFVVPANIESIYITALILILLITPPSSSQSYLTTLPFLIWASIWAMASKYMFGWRGKHLFNPAAFAIALTALTIGQSASWWVGTSSLLPVVALGGLLVVRKIKRFELVLSFLLFIVVSIIVLRTPGTNISFMLQRVIMHTPIAFFAFIMLTEPLTSPPTKLGQIFYGALVGLIYSPNIHLGSFYSTPEFALLIGNIFSFIISPKGKYLLRLKEKIQTGIGLYDFVFVPNHPIKFKPGQYLEWTLGHKKSDSRGNRRYFTIASSPTESKVRLGVRYYEQPSSFKRALANLNPGDTILAGALSGEFTLPKDSQKKLAFLAGGIGITPFRSILKYLVDKNQRRDITLFYSNNLFEEIVYEDVLLASAEKNNTQVVITLTDEKKVPADWQGHTGYINAEMITKELPDYEDRLFYVSGSRSFVVAMEKVLASLDIPKSHIKTDFFPGFV